MKISELTGPALEWAVELAEGRHIKTHQAYIWLPKTNYQGDWAQGGPIIEREEIDIYCHESPKSGCGWWVAEITGTKAKAKGNTPLIAAMRWYCCAKLGDEIEIPQELQPCQQPNL